ncbi:hypothetical protein J2X12_003683 [Pseudarthrobacter oxydans]|uniref:Uncharacterized protein n=1 Tax=Pseudarthrobacter oxydans TaxID=1671 RepID=A0AAW8NGP2_PSEOX|nr:hypothetical protein [Pseudarthrobacter oxydans]MDR7165629.1 hypothetical protein [Pseudarthrobacter oxydans]
MSIIDTIGIIGEMLSWIGAIIGIPFLITAVIINAIDGPRSVTKVTIVEDLDQQRIAIWSVKERTYTRHLTSHDDLRDHDSTTVTGYVPERRPDRLHLHKRSHAERLCRTLAITMLSTAAIGFVTSLLPIFW